MPLRPLILAVALTSGVFVLTGCNDTDPPVSPNPVDQTSTTTPPIEPADGGTPVEPDPPAVSLEVKSLKDVDKLVASQKGKFVVMDLWALW